MCFSTLLFIHWQTVRRNFILLVLLLLIDLSWNPSKEVVAGPTSSGTVIISQVYGGGGNSGSTYKNDFVELFNKGNTTVDLSGWSIQYASSTGTFASSKIVPLSGTIAPGHYYLIQLATGGAGNTALPTPTITASVDMAATAGKVALAITTVAVTGSTDSNVVDFIGYGSTANDSEGSPTLAPSATNSVSRNSNGCTDTDNNRNDFTASAANPRNASSAANICGAELTATPTSLVNFVTTSGAASDEQSYTLTGTGTTSAATITAPTGYKISLASGGPYTTTVTTSAPNNNSLNTTVYVVLDGTSSGTTTGTIINVSGSLTVNITVSGTSNAPVASTSVVRWDGGAGTKFWFDAANWSTDVVPAANADVVLDHSVVIGSYQVLLQSSSTIGATVEPSVSVQSLTVDPAGKDSIFFEVPAFNTNGSALTLTRSGTNDIALAIHDRGVVTNSSATGTGSTTGAGVTVANSNPTVYIYNGGTYRHYTNRSHAVIVDNLAPAAGTEYGRWEFRVTVTSSSSLSLSKRSYPTLILRNNLTTSATSYTGSGSALTVRGNLLIGPNVTFSPNITGDFKVAGNLMIQGVMRLDPTTSGSPTTGRLVLNGAVPQTIRGSAFGTPGSGSYMSTGVTLQISNTAGVVLAAPVMVNGALQLTAGQLITDTANLLTLAAGATTSTGSGFVNGPVAAMATGPTTLSFPLGRSNGQTTAYRPTSLLITTLTTPTTFVAIQNEGSALGPLNGNLTRVSKKRYYTITPTPTLTPGSFLGQVSLSFGKDDFVTDPAVSTFVIAKNDGAGWDNIGRSGYTGSADGGTLTSGQFTSFSDFALGSTDLSTVQNPLPVEMVYFVAQRTSTGISLRWKTASELNCQHFAVERSNDGTIFTPITRVPGHGTTTQPQTYQQEDATTLTGPLYYRLRQLDTDGHEAFSPVRVVSAASEEVGIYPNPMGKQFTLSVAAPTSFRIVNEVGTTVYEGKAKLGTTHYTLPALPSGIYMLETQVEGQPVKRQKIILAQ